MATDLPYVVRAEIEGSFESERWVNVMHFARVGLTTVTLADLQSLAGILDDAATDNDSLAHIYQTMDTQLTVDTLTLTSLSNASPVQYTTALAIAGTSSGANVPPMLAAVVKWSSAVATRSGRGRTFLSGLNTGFISSSNADRLASTVITDLTTRATDWVGAWDASAVWAFGVLSEKQRQENASFPFRDVVSATVNPLICVQRRRRERPL